MADNRVIIIRHGDDPPDDRVHTYLLLHGFAPEVIRPFNGDPLPTLDASIVGSVVHGGPFSVVAADAFPFLRDEHRWIEQCLEAELPLLGICQGAQSIAHVLGAHVGPPAGGQREFGYHTIRPTADGHDFLPAPLVVMQAHFHGFDVPAGAVRLAESDLYPNQAFRVGEHAYGIQFHPEVTIEGYRRWLVQPWFEEHAPGTQPSEEEHRRILLHDEAQAAWFHGLLERLFGRDA